MRMKSQKQTKMTFLGRPEVDKSIGPRDSSQRTPYVYTALFKFKVSDESKKLTGDNKKTIIYCILVV